MKILPRRLSKPRGAILLALGVVVVLSITTSTALAKPTAPADKHQQRLQRNEAQGQQTQQQHQQQHHEGDHVDINNEFGLGDHSSFHGAFDTDSSTGGEQLHKMIGVDYKPEGAARIEYGQLQQQQQQQADFLVRDGENAERDEDMRGENVGIVDRCLVFSDEFDKLDNSVWRVSFLFVSCENEGEERA